MTVRFRFVLGFAITASALSSGTAVCQTPVVPDTTTASVRTSSWIPPSNPLDTVSAREFAAPRSFSLDQFLETLPGYLIGRTGPIGAEAAYSRYGFGSGRGLVYLGGVTLNDPQDGRVPLALTPTTSIAELVFGASSIRYLPGQSNIEGVIQILEPQELSQEPTVAVELSKGDHDLKQRRARYSSPRKTAGIDIGYDELRNAGYAWDASGLTDGPGYGSSTTRMLTAELRGVFPHGEEYGFSLRQFETTFQGDTLDALSENRRTGFIALVETSLDAFDVDVFGRSYKVSTRDSVTMNQTTAVAATVPLTTSDERRVLLGLGYENIFSKQDIAGGSTSDRLQNASAAVAGSAVVGDNTLLEIAADVSHHFNLSWGWGARVSATQEVGSNHRLTVAGKRGYRMPNLSELFLPFHRLGNSNTVDAVGNRDLDSESSLEASALLFTDVGFAKNEIRLTGVRVRNPILQVQTAPSPNPLIVPMNTDSQGLQLVEDRLRLRSSVWGFEYDVGGGFMWALGTRDRFFEGVPEVRAVAAASIGRSLFKDTSHILVGGDYVYSGSRTAGGVELSPYSVVNMKLEGRLVDAHLYLLWLNISDEQYETIWPYLMTPRTFVYGIAWTFFN
jgi:outer membrane cobalamin receptor